MKWIVGLGNPGTAYQGTRHNVGFMAVDALAKRWGISVTQSKCKALIGEGNVGGTKVALIKPMTYMNLSGETVRGLWIILKPILRMQSSSMMIWIQRSAKSVFATKEAQAGTMVLNLLFSIQAPSIQPDAHGSFQTEAGHEHR